MKKVMFVIGSLSNGGAERVVANIANGLSQKGYQVSILNYYKCESEYPINNHITRYLLSDTINDFNNIGNIKKIFKIRKIIKKFKPDNIICFLSNPSVYTFISLIGTKYLKKISFAIRGNPFMDNEKTTRLQMFLSKYVKYVITQNRGQIKCLNKSRQKKAIVIPNPIYDNLYNLKKEYSINPTKIVSVGRLHKQKNYILAINALEEAVKIYPNIRYYIYGVGEQENYLKELILKKNLVNNIILMGYENDREKIFLDKDIFLMTSLFEGMPNALSEALTIGIPSISTNCDFGPSDLILDSKMGILLDNFDIETLVNSLIDMINNYNHYVDNAVYAKNKLKELYSYDEVLKKWMSIL